MVRTELAGGWDAGVIVDVVEVVSGAVRMVVVVVREAAFLAGPDVLVPHPVTSRAAMTKASVVVADCRTGISRTVPLSCDTSGVEVGNVM